jgi:hypothetical protein
MQNLRILSFLGGWQGGRSFEQLAPRAELVFKGSGTKDMQHINSVTEL